MDRPSAEDIIQTGFILLVLLSASIYLLRRLYFAIAFYKAIRGIPEEKLLMTRARVKTSIIRRRRFYGSDSTTVVYERDGGEAKAKMICACEKKLHKDDELNVLLDRTGRYFALDVQQLKNALLTWSVLGFLSLLLTCGSAALFVLALNGRL